MLEWQHLAEMPSFSPPVLLLFLQCGISISETNVSTAERLIKNPNLTSNNNWLFICRLESPNSCKRLVGRSGDWVSWLYDHLNIAHPTNRPFHYWSDYLSLKRPMPPWAQLVTHSEDSVINFAFRIGPGLHNTALIDDDEINVRR